MSQLSPLVTATTKSEVKKVYLIQAPWQQLHSFFSSLPEDTAHDNRVERLRGSIFLVL